MEGLADALGGTFGKISYDTVEIADGGDGSLGAVKSVWGSKAESVWCRAADPLGRYIDVEYLISRPIRKGEESGHGIKAFIEMARVSGLVLLSGRERNPLKTSSFGLGEVVNDAVRRGATEIYLSIGGSATNDGGTGMLQALGYVFYRRDALSGENIPVKDRMCGGLLGEIVHISSPEVSFARRGVKLYVVCDVTNPLLGPNGATCIYGEQKGADPAMLEKLEEGMENYARGYRSDFPGAGAAGGVGFAAGNFLNAELIRGWEFFFELTSLRERIRQADLVISGEGSIDAQSFNGKLIDGISSVCREFHKPLLLFCGKSEITEPAGEKRKIYAISDIEPDMERSMKEASSLLRKVAYGAASEFKR